MTVDRFDEATCGVCGRSATGIGHAPSGQNKKVMWLCDDETCITTAKNTYDTPQDRFNGIEIFACREGGMDGAAYLQDIGKDAIYDLSEPEWNEFLRRVIAGYRKALKSGLETEAPF